MADSTYLKIENIGNSYMGTAYITPKYGSHAGEIIEAFELQNLDIKCRKTIQRRRTLNNKTYQHRVIAKEYILSGSLFACSTILQEIEAEYDEAGVQPIFDMDVTNNWEQDGLGKQRVKLEGVMLENYDVLKLAVESDDTPQSFDGYAVKCRIMESAVRPNVEYTP